MTEHARYIISNHEIAQIYESEAGSFIKTRDANFSQAVGFKKLGIHHVTLLPGARTSLPHAESLEEEFVFVISGSPHVWIDGYIYELKSNYAVGFPAGTGIAHTFINNTNSVVELLVIGERTKAENLCSFPVHPEQKEICGIWWADVPARVLGPHRGEPGPILPHEIGKSRPPYLVDCAQLRMSKGWHYAGDTETFSEYARLTDHLGLKALGIGYETLAPGHRSAYPHAHKTEEEFVYILSGTAQIWMNGFVYEAKPGDGVAFLPGTNIAHCVINDTNEPLSYIVVGETIDLLKEDRVYYPLHPFRNEQCRKKKNLWEDRPRQILGPHIGRPKNIVQEDLSLRHTDANDEILILDIFKNSPNYFLRVDGCEPSLKIVRHAMIDGPQKKSASYLKEFLLIEYNGRPMGVVDIHINHPEVGIVYLGLLLITENLFGQGLGRKTYGLVEHYVKTIFDAKLVRIGVSDNNDVSSFWKRLGFLPNGNTYSWKGESNTNHVVEYDKQVT